MINFGFLSRNVADPAGYAQMVKDRLEAKARGDYEKANAWKLCINTSYGASLNKWNDMYDPWSGRSVCITGQLLLTILARLYILVVPSAEIIQINTDGIMVAVDEDELPLIEEINQSWSNDYGFSLSEEKIKGVYQKDVNNYVAVNLDGKITGKGGFVSAALLSDPFGYEKNDLAVVADAIVQYFVNHVPPEETIKKETNILRFQMIAHASGKYHGVKYGEKEVQKTNRVYAAKDHSLPTLHKQSKLTNNWVKIPSIPEHCIIDNENKLTLDDIDIEWYVHLAKDRIDQFKK